jgi:hypothetical protein
MDPPHMYYIQVPSSMVEDHTQSDSMTGPTLFLLCQLQRDSMLYTSLLSTRETTRISKPLKSHKLTTWLHPSGHLFSLPYYIPDPSES